MKFKVIPILVLTVFFLFLVPQALAHAPLGTGDNESLATATIIPDPTKSWALYAELHEGGEAQYYRLEMTKDQTIHVMLHKSIAQEDSSFLPGLVLIGPGITSQGTVPNYVEVPNGNRTMVIGGTQPSQAIYEPFSASALYPLAEVELKAPSSGTYYVAVYEPSRGGHYNIAIGDREEFTLNEWILIPINLISIYQWQYQSLAFIFAPIMIMFMMGMGLIIRRARPKILSHWIGASAGLLFLGSGGTTLLQMITALTVAPLDSGMIITIMLALAPLVLGVITLRLSLKKNVKLNLKRRTYLAILGIVALFTWSGVLVGPALAIVASIVPSRKHHKVD